MESYTAPTSALLYEHHLLDYVNNLTGFTTAGISYDSRKVKSGTLFFCKESFLPKYLTSAKERDAIAYVAKKECPGGEGLSAIIVNDEQKAVSLLGAAFYDYPRNDLFIIAITETKGKTTTAYFADHILAQSTANHVALFSALDRILDNKPEDGFKSGLTTPGSLDLFHDMYAIVNNGMTRLVMEVSLQAYKKNQVYGLKYDVGIFLNISPDHIGRNEHPTFADYLHCKEQLLVDSAKCLVNVEAEKFTDVYYTTETATQPEDIFLFTRRGANIELPDNVQIDFEYRNDLEDLRGSEFELTALTEKAEQLNLDGRYKTSVPGGYNEGNAVVAIIASGLAGASANDAAETLSHVHIHGRMEMIDSNTHETIYVDYAHNYASLKQLLVFLERQTDAGKVTVVLGATGDKGISRRPGFGKALTEKQPDEIVLTADDPELEDSMTIAREVGSYIDHDKVKRIRFEMNHGTAIKKAINGSGNDDIVVLAGKGEDPYQKINGKDVPYLTDVEVARDYINDLEK